MILKKKTCGAMTGAGIQIHVACFRRTRVAEAHHQCPILRVAAWPFDVEYASICGKDVEARVRRFV